MTSKQLTRLGIKEVELRELNDKWIAIQLRHKRTKDSVILVDDDGLTIASENLIDVQEKVSDLYPELFENNKGGKLVVFKHIPKEFNLI